MKDPRNEALDALNRTIKRSYDKLSDHGKAVRDEREESTAKARRLYGSRTLATKKPKVRKAIP